jgi:large subunit ribosomal protein L28
MKGGVCPRMKIMARVCSVSGKKPSFGNNISHANNKTRRRFQPNIQVCSFPSEILGKPVRLRLTANGIRTVEHNGGVDAWLLGTRDSRLGEAALKIKKQIVRAQERLAKAA